MERASSIFKRIMLGIISLILVVSMLLTVRAGTESPSFLFALLLGLAWAAGLYLLWGRFKDRLRIENVKKAALILTLICAAANLLWVLIIRIEPFSDYETYWQCACAIATGGEIVTPWYIAMYPHILGCASFLSIFVRIFGQHVMVAALTNVALSCISGLLIYCICLKLSDIKTACMAYLLWALCPSKLMLNSLVFSEPLYTCLILLFFLMLLHMEQKRETLSASLLSAALWGIGLGLVLRFINIVRPISAILIIALFLWLLLLRGRRAADLKEWRLWAVALIPMLLCYSVGGRLWDVHVEEKLSMEPASVPVYNIYVGFNEQTQGQWSAEDMDLLFSYFKDQGMSTGEAQKSMIPHLKERLKSGIDFKRLFASKLFAFMGSDELGGYTYRFTRGEMFVKICMVICNVFYYGVMALALRGLLTSYGRLSLSASTIIPIYFIGLTLAHLLIEVSVRYHYSLIPLLIIFAALGLNRGGAPRRST